MARNAGHSASLAALGLPRMTGWLYRAGKYKVEHVPCPHPGGLVNMASPPSGIMHTVEGSLASGLAVFRQHYAPHFLVGPGRILQLVPLGYMAAAVENHPGGVETNSLARVQIEVATYSKMTPWLPDPKTLDALAALLATLEFAAGIPLTRPFADWLPPGPWASYTFVRRHSGKWGKVPGWYGHIEIPENAHWDPGALKWKELLALAHAHERRSLKVKPKPRKKVLQPKTEWWLHKHKSASPPRT